MSNIQYSDHKTFYEITTEDEGFNSRDDGSLWSISGVSTGSKTDIEETTRVDSENNSTIDSLDHRPNKESAISHSESSLTNASVSSSSSIESVIEEFLQHQKEIREKFGSVLEEQISRLRGKFDPEFPPKTNLAEDSTQTFMANNEQLFSLRRTLSYVLLYVDEKLKSQKQTGQQRKTSFQEIRIDLHELKQEVEAILQNGPLSDDSETAEKEISLHNLICRLLGILDQVDWTQDAKPEETTQITGDVNTESVDHVHGILSLSGQNLLSLFEMKDKMYEWPSQTNHQKTTNLNKNQENSTKLPDQIYGEEDYPCDKEQKYMRVKSAPLKRSRGGPVNGTPMEEPQKIKEGQNFIAPEVRQKRKKIETDNMKDNAYSTQKAQKMSNQKDRRGNSTKYEEPEVFENYSVETLSKMDQNKDTYVCSESSSNHDNLLTHPHDDFDNILYWNYNDRKQEDVQDVHNTGFEHKNELSPSAREHYFQSPNRNQEHTVNGFKNFFASPNSEDEELYYTSEPVARENICSPYHDDERQSSPELDERQSSPELEERQSSPELFTKVTYDKRARDDRKYGGSVHEGISGEIDTCVSPISKHNRKAQASSPSKEVRANKQQRESDVFPQGSNKHEKHPTIPDASDTNVFPSHFLNDTNRSFDKNKSKRKRRQELPKEIGNQLLTSTPDKETTFSVGTLESFGEQKPSPNLYGRKDFQGPTGRDVYLEESQPIKNENKIHNRQHKPIRTTPPTSEDEQLYYTSELVARENTYLPYHDERQDSPKLFTNETFGKKAKSARKHEDNINKAISGDRDLGPSTLNKNNMKKQAASPSKEFHANKQKRKSDDLTRFPKGSYKHEQHQTVPNASDTNVFPAYFDKDKFDRPGRQESPKRIGNRLLTSTPEKERPFSESTLESFGALKPSPNRNCRKDFQGTNVRDVYLEEPQPIKDESEFLNRQHKPWRTPPITEGTVSRLPRQDDKQVCRINNTMEPYDQYLVEPEAYYGYKNTLHGDPFANFRENELSHSLDIQTGSLSDDDISFTNVERSFILTHASPRRKSLAQELDEYFTEHPESPKLTHTPIVVSKVKTAESKPETTNQSQKTAVDNNNMNHMFGGNTNQMFAYLDESKRGDIKPKHHLKEDQGFQNEWDQLYFAENKSAIGESRPRRQEMQELSKNQMKYKNGQVIDHQQLCEAAESSLSSNQPSSFYSVLTHFENISSEERSPRTKSSNSHFSEDSSNTCFTDSLDDRDKGEHELGISEQISKRTTNHENMGTFRSQSEFQDFVAMSGDHENENSGNMINFDNFSSPFQNDTKLYACDECVKEDDVEVVYQGKGTLEKSYSNIKNHGWKFDMDGGKVFAVVGSVHDLDKHSKADQSTSQQQSEVFSTGDLQTKETEPTTNMVQKKEKQTEQKPCMDGHNTTEQPSAVQNQNKDVIKHVEDEPITHVQHSNVSQEADSFSDVNSYKESEPSLSSVTFYSFTDLPYTTTADKHRKDLNDISKNGEDIENKHPNESSDYNRTIPQEQIFKTADKHKKDPNDISKNGENIENKRSRETSDYSRRIPQEQIFQTTEKLRRDQNDTSKHGENFESKRPIETSDYSLIIPQGQIFQTNPSTIMEADSGKGSAYENEFDHEVSSNIARESEKQTKEQREGEQKDHEDRGSICKQQTSDEKSVPRFSKSHSEEGSNRNMYDQKVFPNQTGESGNSTVEQTITEQQHHVDRGKNDDDKFMSGFIKSNSGKYSFENGRDQSKAGKSETQTPQQTQPNENDNEDHKQQNSGEKFVPSFLKGNSEGLYQEIFSSEGTECEKHKGDKHMDHKNRGRNYEAQYQPQFLKTYSGEGSLEKRHDQEGFSSQSGKSGKQTVEKTASHEKDSQDPGKICNEHQNDEIYVLGFLKGDIEEGFREKRKNLEEFSSKAGESEILQQAQTELKDGRDINIISKHPNNDEKRIAKFQPRFFNDNALSKITPENKMTNVIHDTPHSWRIPSSSSDSTLIKRPCRCELSAHDKDLTILFKPQPGKRRKGYSRLWLLLLFLLILLLVSQIRRTNENGGAREFSLMEDISKLVHLQHINPPLV